MSFAINFNILAGLFKSFKYSAYLIIFIPSPWLFYWRKFLALGWFITKIKYHAKTLASILKYWFKYDWKIEPAYWLVYLRKFLAPGWLINDMKYHADTGLYIEHYIEYLIYRCWNLSNILRKTSLFLITVSCWFISHTHIHLRKF